MPRFFGGKFGRPSRINGGPRREDVGRRVDRMFRPLSVESLEARALLSGTFTVPFGSATLGRPAEVAIEAVVRTELLVWHYQVLQNLYESDMAWQKVGRRVAEMLYVRKEQRELSFLLLDAETRYRNMLAQFGTQADAIPQYFLASYLGIRPQSLSRLKRRIAVSPMNRGE